MSRYIAMWSGPRNISTAMMRAWGSRPDTAVIDEPFYAHYLKETGIDHPGAAAVIGSQPTDWRTVVQQICGDIPQNKTIYYQKHITTHMLEPISLDWLGTMQHCFLIRNPEKVVASYTQQRPTGNATDLGYQQQLRIYQHVCDNLDHQPVVIDSDLFLQNPAAQLRAICANLQIEFTEAMLSWEPGIRKTDGVWHSWWYDAVAKSTGFMPWQDKTVSLTAAQAAVAKECQPYYSRMRLKALTAPD